MMIIKNKETPMSRISILDIYKQEIVEFIDTGASLRSIWKIISSKMPKDITISYAAFFRYCKRKGLK